MYTRSNILECLQTGTVGQPEIGWTLVTGFPLVIDCPFVYVKFAFEQQKKRQKAHDIKTRSVVNIKAKAKLKKKQQIFTHEFMTGKRFSPRKLLNIRTQSRRTTHATRSAQEKQSSLTRLRA